MHTTTILFIGDIVGKAGRQTVKALVPQLRSEYAAHLVIANGENAAGGFGLTAAIADELFAGVLSRATKMCPA